MPKAPQAVPASAKTDRLKKSLGAFGEMFTCHELGRRGYEIVDRNVRFPVGEIDIIARQGGEFVFVEVKTRRSSPYAQPEDAVTAERMSHLERAIDLYLISIAAVSASYRIEVAAVDVDRSGRVTRFEILGDVGLR